MNVVSAILAILLAAPPAAPAAPAAQATWFDPSPGNLYVSTTEKHLYVVWALPKSLEPLPAQPDDTARRLLVARTAVHLCLTHRAKAPDKACMVHVLRMNSNDEYTKSAAGGFVSLGKLVLPAAAATTEVRAQVAAEPLPAAQARFTRFDLDLTK